MTDAERMSLLLGIMPVAFPGSKVVVPENVPATAGYVPGVPRLGVPAQLATDASLGVTNPNLGRPGDTATAMPSGLALASTFNPALAERIGATVGREARSKGFNVLLGGGMNLSRDPRNGRNFEYLGEDPLLAGTLAGHAIRGTQSQGVVSTIKHFALNGQETLRFTANSVIGEAGFRESELLAFELGIEIGQPGSVMCAYNLVNGHKACGNDFLLNQVLKRDWGYKGWVMSDWGAVSDARFFQAGLDQQSGSQLDKQPWFGAPLQTLIEQGEIPKARVSDAVRRMLRSLYAVGIEAAYPHTSIDTQAGAATALEAAHQGMVLLRNEKALLPLEATRWAGKQILVVGGQADFGVLTGGGSSQVTPTNGEPRVIGGTPRDLMTMFSRQTYLPGSPLAALRKALPQTTFQFISGYDAETSAAAARHADLVIVFATQWEGEGSDSGSLALPQGQDELITQLAAANEQLVVVLETGNPITMPWLKEVRAVLQAWYPGQEGGQAISDVLTGAVNPSGRLPLTFPRSLSQTPHPALPGQGLPSRSAVDVNYQEGADAGYRWWARTGQSPLFPFGFGLSYTHFNHDEATARWVPTTPGSPRHGQVELSLRVRNGGQRAGADVPQAYLISRRGRSLLRLVGFERVALQPGEERRITLRVDPRLLADWRDGGWQIEAGRYAFAFGASATALTPAVTVDVPAQRVQP